MKKWLIPLLAALLLWRLLPSVPEESTEEVPVEVPDPSPDTAVIPALWQPAPPRVEEVRSEQEDSGKTISEEAAAPSGRDASERIRLLTPGGVITLSLRDYLIGVVAAEMPASFELEALKAQAVASRSCTLHNLRFGQSRHSEAEVCTSSACCQAYRSDEELRSRWGDNYAVYLDKITEAVDATDGLCLYYGEELIYAPYHSSSAGATEDSSAIWSAAPYLVSVESPETEALVPGYCVSVSFTEEELKEKLAASYPGLKEQPLLIGEISYTASGRVESVDLGGQKIPATRLRSLLALRSTSFTLEKVDGKYIFTTQGWGHGVGMSQYGAEALAMEGEDSASILSRYYQGTELRPFED